MIFIMLFRTSVFLLVSGGIITLTKATSLPVDLENHRASSHRPSWPVAWFSNREGSSVSLLSRERHERDGKNRIHGKHESQQRMPRIEVHNPSGTRIMHDSLVRNSRNRYETEMKERRRNFNDDGLFGRSENESLRYSGSEKSSSSVRFTKDDLIETRIARPTTTTTKMNGGSRSSSSSGNNDDVAREGSNESEKLTAVAVAKYSGTRAVAYAGYHHHNFDYNPTRMLTEKPTTGYELVATAETPIYTKHHAGRRVCTRQTPNSIAHHHRSRQYRLVYTELTASTFLCCPGWSQVSRTSYGCNRPTCAAPCLNGGVCGTHGKCNCPKGYMGTQCQTDVDECLTEKPCGQICKNLFGSYECHCRHGFHLQPDRQSCRKNGSDGTAFEARDLENDYSHTISTTTEVPKTTSASRDTENEVGEGKLDQDYEVILKRLAKLEKQIAKGRKREIEVSEMNTRIAQAVEGVAAMRRAVDNVQLMQQEIYDMRGKVKQFELESRKLQHLTNRVTDLENRLKIRCRTSING